MAYTRGIEQKTSTGKENVVNIAAIKAAKSKGWLLTHPFVLPEAKAALSEELANSTCLRLIKDHIQVFLVEGNHSPTVMREIGRLREIAFQFVGEGTGNIRDVDSYDAYYHQIVLWDSAQQVIIGGYRMAKAKEVIKQYGLEGLYNHRLFQFHQDILPKLEQGIELGRKG